MATYLILVSIGPVQEFIAQARRTRDLWYGSELLSELSRSVARSLADSGAELIFPHSAAARNVANKILARLEGADEARVLKVVRTARTALYDLWKKTAERIRKEAQDLLAKDSERLWDEQIASLLEFAAVWKDEKGSYKETRDALESALAARKNVREFAPWTEQSEGVAKSSLDGARQSVLRAGEKRHSLRFAQYRINPEEQLDAVGLVKRMGGRPEQFVPLTNAALGPWIEKAAERVPDALKAMVALCEAPREEGAAFTRIDPRLPYLESFPYDAQVFLADRSGPIAKEIYPASKRKDDPELYDKFNALRDALRSTSRKAFGRKGMREPYPYVACLVADGDKMGATLDALTEHGQHKRFSDKLAEFAGRAKQIVQTDHLGSLVYSGGDDVLAFVSLPHALACAHALKDAFAKLMKETLAEMGVKATPPTLSVGLGVGHVLESMGYLLTLGRNAEKLAKGAALKVVDDRRDALAILVDKRSGGLASYRAKWGEEPVSALRRAVDQLNDFTLPTGKVYEIRTFLRRMPSPTEVQGDASAYRDVLEFDTRRILARASGDGEELTPDHVGLDLHGDTYRALYGAIDAWVNQMLIAKVFAESERALSPKGQG